MTGPLACSWSRAKVNYFKNLKPRDSKKFWKAVKYLNGQQSTIPTFQQGEQTASTDQQKAELLNSFFSTCLNRFHLQTVQYFHSCRQDPCMIAERNPWLHQYLSQPPSHLILGVTNQFPSPIAKLLEKHIIMVSCMNICPIIKCYSIHNGAFVLVDQWLLMGDSGVVIYP